MNITNEVLEKINFKILSTNIKIIIIMFSLIGLFNVCNSIKYSKSMTLGKLNNKYTSNSKYLLNLQYKKASDYIINNLKNNLNKSLDKNSNIANTNNIKKDNNLDGNQYNSSNSIDQKINEHSYTNNNNSSINISANSLNKKYSFDTKLNKRENLKESIDPKFILSKLKYI